MSFLVPEHIVDTVNADPQEWNCERIVDIRGTDGLAGHLSLVEFTSPAPSVTLVTSTTNRSPVNKLYIFRFPILEGRLLKVSEDLRRCTCIVFILCSTSMSNRERGTYNTRDRERICGASTCD